MIFTEIEFTRDRMTHEDAAELTRRAMRYDSEITLEYGTRKLNAKSLMGVLSMGLKQGERVTVLAVGDDEKAAVEDLSALLA